MEKLRKSNAEREKQVSLLVEVWILLLSLAIIVTGSYSGCLDGESGVAGLGGGGGAVVFCSCCW